jgi:hypothetical protein
VAQEARHQHDLGAVGLGQACCERIGDLLRREILVLDVDIALRARDHVEIQAFDVIHCRRAVAGGCGAGQAEVRIGQVGHQGVGPRIATHVHRLQTLVRRSPPACARRFGERRGSFTIDARHDIVHRRIGLAVEHAARLLRTMGRSVPALAGEIQSADESDAIVDDHDLLVMRSRQRMRVVEAEVNAAMWLPRQTIER